MDEKRTAELEAFLATFTGGWDHFLKCCNLAQNWLDAEAIGWMNEIGLMSTKLEKKQ